MKQQTVAAEPGGDKQGRECELPVSSGMRLPDVPLVVDLDGTLVKTDLLVESLMDLVKKEPQYIFALPFWLLKGRAEFKQEIAYRVSLDPQLIPYRPQFVEYVRAQRAQGRQIILATAGDKRYAQQVADHLKLFDSVLASDGKTNLSGKHKRERLVAQFGERGFDYAANGHCDREVLASARNTILVNPNRHMARVAAKEHRRQVLFEDRGTGPAEYLRALRPQQWLKNLLLFIPLLAAHEFYQPELWGKVLLGFLAFCCCASSGYLFNDLVDLTADRRHPNKRLRPFAAGRLPISYALLMVPGLLVIGFVVGGLVSKFFLEVLLLYYLLTVLYSLYVKKIVMLDVLVLAGLYTLRVIAGGAAVWIWPSEWLLAFTTFFFVSLALLKRYGELVVMRKIEGEHATARGYRLADTELLASMGIVSGYLAVVVLALDITSGKMKALYTRPEFMWFLCPLLLYWIGHLWLVAHRGEMHDDPIVFALRNRKSQISILLMVGTALLAI